MQNARLKFSLPASIKPFAYVRHLFSNFRLLLPSPFLFPLQWVSQVKRWIFRLFPASIYITEKCFINILCRFLFYFSIFHFRSSKALKKKFFSLFSLYILIIWNFEFFEFFWKNLLKLAVGIEIGLFNMFAQICFFLSSFFCFFLLLLMKSFMWGLSLENW